MCNRVLVAFCLLVFAVTAYAGSTGTTALHMPQGEDASRPFGDFVSDNDAGALNTFYRYFIEVPPGITRLQVELFDADVGLGGMTEDTAGRDRARAASFSTVVNYSLRDPAGTVRTARFTTGDATQPTGSDNAWLDLYNATGNDVLDQFGTNAYNNNDGNNNWSTDWVETDGGGGGATGGAIRVITGELRVGDNVAGTPNIYRQADLLGSPGLNMGMAFLTFDYRTSANLEDADQVTVQISNDGGASFTPLETFSNDSSGSRSYDITAFIANNTRVRFLVAGGLGAGEFFFFDNVRISDGPITAGHWELRVDQTNGSGNDVDINALGIRAHDGTSGSGGTELNVYADAMLSLGVNPSASGSGANSRSYTLYPWITSGCTCSHNDFDLDTNNGNTGSAAYTSRSGAFSQTFAAATLSQNDVWNRDSTATFTSDSDAIDYGIWSLGATVETYFTPAVNGNYETIYVANSLAAANPPAANPPTNSFRIYLPTDAGNAPLKPYLEQFVRAATGVVTPTVGVVFPATVTVRITNPTAHAITFSASNLVTANVPGGGAVYGGSAQVSQGTIVSQPAVGGTGNITWNPGTVAAGDTALLAYLVAVTPAAAGQRIPVTATPASGNGTRAQYVDETGNTTQARATALVGPICEVAVTEGLLTDVLLSSFRIDGSTIEWTTASEGGTIGFHLYRENGERVNDSLIPASHRAHGGTYRVVDSFAAERYILEEVTASGRRNRYGPLDRIEGRERPMRERALSVPQVLGSKEDIEAVMIGVPSTGIVRVTAADLASAFGESVSKIQKEMEKGQLAITNRGASVAWTTDGNALYFFGEKSDSIYSNDRVYRIEREKGATMKSVVVSPASVPVSSFTIAREIETDVFAATVLPLDPESDYWFQDFFLSGDPTYGRKTFPIDVPAVASASGVSLDVRLQGAFKDTPHRARVTLNGVPLGDATWDSFDAHAATFAVPSAVLRDGANEIVIEGLLEGGAPFDIFYVDGFTLRYERYARPENGKIEVRRGGSIAAGPFGVAPMILDVTNRLKPSVLRGASFIGGTSSLVAPQSATALYFTESFVAPSFFRGSAEAKLKEKRRADWVVVAPRAMRDAAESLARLHERDGLSTFVVDLEQVYDEFAGGNTTPHAIRDFFTSTRKWSRPPLYYVLAGTGTVDYRAIEVPPGPMPPLMTSTPDGLYASDSLFIDRNGDKLPDAAIGRIPVSTAEELEAYVRKLEANARVSASDQKIIFSADAVDRGADFRRASVLAEAPLASRPLTRVYLDELGASGARTSLMNAWQSGSSLVSWIGHGGLDLLSPTAFLTASDAPSLTSTGRLPMLVAMTCTINRFENGYVEPLGGALTRESDAGAIAVWSASGLSMHAQASEIQRTFTRLAAQSPRARIGDLVVRSLAAFPGDTSSVYLLLGDPAVRLELPQEVVHGGAPSAPGE